MTNSIRRLPDSELEVMQALWVCPSPASRADMEIILAKTHPMAQTTLLTLLSRLCEKGFVRTEKSGRITHYFPLITKEDYLANQSKRFFRNLCGGSISTFAAALCDSGLSKEELQELRDLLERDAL